MPADAFGAAAESVLSRRRRIGLRVALAVAAGFTLNLATGEVIPFFGPVLAVQFLIFGAGPLPLSKAVAFVGLVLVVGQAFIVLNGIFGNHPIQLQALLGLFFFVCFFVQARGQGGPVIFLCLVIAIMVTLLDRVHDTLDSSIIAILLQAYLSAVVLSWLAHAILPSHDAIEDASQAAPAIDRPAIRALANAAILLGAMALCLTNNALSLALVLPITVASVLLQFDFATSVRSAFSLVAVNLLSGVLASLAFAFVELRPSLPFPVPDRLSRRADPGRAGRGRRPCQDVCRSADDIPHSVRVGHIAVAHDDARVVFDPDRLRPVGGRVHSVHDGATLAARTICFDKTRTAVIRARCDPATGLAGNSASLASAASPRTPLRTYFGPAA
jgi:hypothetical protein